MDSAPVMLTKDATCTRNGNICAKVEQNPSRGYREIHQVKFSVVSLAMDTKPR